MIQKQLHDRSIVEAYPMTQAQRTMYFVYNQYGRNAAVLNICVGYYWKGAFDAGLMRQALAEAMNRCDTIRLRFTPDNQFGLVQYLADESGIAIEEEDLTDMTYDEACEVCRSWAKQGVDFIECPLHTIRVMHLPDGYNGFFMRLHHLAFDGYSARVLMGDVMAIYLNKKCGQPYPKPMKSYLEAMKGELAYLESDRRKEDRNYFIQKFSAGAEPVFNDYLLHNRLDEARKEAGNEDRRFILLWEGEHPESRTLQYELTAEETQTIMKACEENHMSLQTVLMMGVRSALSACNHNQPDVSVKYMVHRRATLLEKKSGGNRWHLYTLRTVVPAVKNFAEAVDIVAGEEEEIFRHSDFDTLEMYYIKHQVMKMEQLEQTYDSLSFSYHAPVVIPAENEEQRQSARGYWYNNDFSCQNLYLTVKHRPADNGLTFVFEYRINENPKHDLEIMFPKILETIRTGLADPQITVGEILEKIKY